MWVVYVLVAWIVLLPLVTVAGLYVMAPLLRRARVRLQPSAAQYVRNRSQENPEIEPQRPVGSVDVVDLDHLVHRDARRSEDLPQTGHPGSQ